MYIYGGAAVCHRLPSIGLSRIVSTAGGRFVNRNCLPVSSFAFEPSTPNFMWPVRASVCDRIYSAYPTLRATYRILLPFARFFPASRSEEFPLFQRQRDVSRRNRRNKFFSFSISFCMCFVSFVCKIITFHFSFLAQQPPFRKKIAHRLAFLKSIM